MCDFDPHVFPSLSKLEGRAAHSGELFGKTAVRKAREFVIESIIMRQRGAFERDGGKASGGACTCVIRRATRGLGAAGNARFRVIALRPHARDRRTARSRSFCLIDLLRKSKDTPLKPHATGSSGFPGSAPAGGMSLSRGNFGETMPLLSGKFPPRSLPPPARSLRSTATESKSLPRHSYNACIIRSRRDANANAESSDLLLLRTTVIPARASRVALLKIHFSHARRLPREVLRRLRLVLVRFFGNFKFTVNVPRSP